MLCALCDKPIRGHKYGVPLWEVGALVQRTHVCERCWNNNDKLSEVIMAKRATAKKAEGGKDGQGRIWPKVRPCEKCGSTEFENDFKRRGHQGKCKGKNPPPEVNTGGVKTKMDRPDKANVPRVLPAKPPPSIKLQEVVPGEPERLGEKGRTRSQIGRGSKQKGNAFENEVKKLLAGWWGEPPEVVGSKNSAFQRSPGSGGTSPANWPLDLHVPPNFLWAVECKNREGPAGMEAMERFLTAPGYPVASWFTEAEAELVKAKIEKPVLLVFTRNQYPIFGAIRRPGAGMDMLTPPFNCLVFTRFPDLELLVMKLEDMLGLIKEWWNTAYQVNSPDSYMPKG